MNRSEIVLLSSELQPGATGRFVCPTCGGGRSRELSLTITLDENGSLVWNCFRAHCDERGADGARPVDPEYMPEKVIKKKNKTFDGTTVALNDFLLDLIRERWGIVDPPYWYYTPDYGGRVAMSIRSPKFTHRGWALRDMTGKQKAKSLTYIDEGEVALSWYKTHPHTGTVIVEDIPSAVRASKYINSVCLLGTGVGDNKAEEIARYAPRPIYMALDQDATALAFKQARRYALLWDDVKVLPLKLDMKDMHEEELQELLGGIA